MSFPIHKCKDCGISIFEDEPCWVCVNAVRFFGSCAHNRPMNMICEDCDRAIRRSQIEGEFQAVMGQYRSAIPYRYAGALSQCIQEQESRIERSERRVRQLELGVVRLLGWPHLSESARQVLNAVMAE